MTSPPQSKHNMKSSQENKVLAPLKKGTVCSLTDGRLYGLCVAIFIGVALVMNIYPQLVFPSIIPSGLNNVDSRYKGLRNLFHLSDNVTKEDNIIYEVKISLFNIDPKLDQHDIYDSSLSNKHIVSDNNEECGIPGPAMRFDCYPEKGGSQSKCNSRGCCWIPSNSGRRATSSDKSYSLAPVGVPSCFYGKNFTQYVVTSRSETQHSISISLSRSTPAYYPNDIKDIQMDVYLETESRLRIKIYDPNKTRFEVPIVVPPAKKPELHTLYDVKLPTVGKSFSIEISRKNPGTVLLNTTNAAPFIFADQFIQLSYVQPSSYIYGLGEHKGDFLLNYNWTSRTLWNHDHPPLEEMNLYGSHPFYLMMEDGGNSHGILLLNSNAMDVILQPAPAITWKTIGGIIDLYVFLGPRPDDVIQQYTSVIGRTFMPPYWSLGFHLSRWGYDTAKKTMEVFERNRKVGIPQDAQWNDIDYMSLMKDFTTAKRFGDQGGMAKQFHDLGLHYVVIVDPGIQYEVETGIYPPYDMGVKMGIFINNSQGHHAVGIVWPGATVFPDFTNPKTQEYWTTLIKEFHDKVNIDGLWIDMNDVSNFVSGSIDGCPTNDLEDPPYVPGIYGGSLKYKTLCASDVQHLSTHYNVHNLYSYTEANMSYWALRDIRGKRPFVLSRSTFAGQGVFGAHWTGDVSSTYHDLFRSVTDVMNMNLFGISMVGADICGFQKSTTEELCQRWFQIGAFYTFCRNHNSLGEKDQDPAAFGPQMVASTRKALLIRYSLLPYLYTLIYKSHAMGSAVIRPLFFEFPNDPVTYANERQFMWGSALLISPVLTEKTLQILAYFPADVFYDFYNGSRIESTGNVTLDAPLDKINLHMRGGHVIPMQKPALTTTDSRKNKFSLLVAFNETSGAEGDLYWDDGDSLDTYQRQAFNMLSFTVNGSGLSVDTLFSGYETVMLLENVTFYGFSKEPKELTANNISKPFVYQSITKVLLVYEINMDILKTFILTWIFSS